MDILGGPDPSSISQVSSTKGAITLPWPKSDRVRLITKLGTGCYSAKLLSDSAVAPFETQPLISAGAFRENVRFRNEVGTKSYFHKAITSSQGSQSEHTSVSAKGSAGCTFANISGTGAYNKSVMENNDDIMASIQATIRTGVIYFDQPRLSLDAIADVRRSRKDPSYFSRKYGDYYVASLRLGADAGLLASVSTKQRSEKESLEVKAKLHVLWWDIEKDYNEEQHSQEAWSSFRITAFETLGGTNVQNGASQEQPATVALSYIQQVSDLEKNVRNKMRALDLKENKTLNREEVQKVCESGLVAEVTLLPCTQIRDYTATLLERD
ncbi:hypothetical protein N7517_009969 [Penicillium concentricum]|uniref:Uncharacterized protein n=1 Tax=Penicillium concentricum TaxID=293559 RepID=A0A9W9RNE1_9EURO|nr:uncharacterized protein N7517_009969 [Penicillium concentricum]KAJ5360778.1 hypothetical protein N7517_009969 [Penicillium concentricum]